MNDDLTQTGLEAIAADILDGSVSESTETNPDQVLMDIANETLGVDAQSSDQASSEPKEDRVSDDTETTESDDESPVEAEADGEDDDEPTDEVNEYFEVSYEDAKDGLYPIKINGEVKMMKFGEIQNQLARAESASKKSQEANSQLQEIEATKDKLAQQEAWLTERAKASQGADQLASIGNHLQQLHTAYEQAAQGQDTHRMSMIKYEIDKTSNAYNQTQHQVKQVQEEHTRRQTAEQYEILKDKGYGDVVTDAYKNYLSANLSDSAVQAASFDATLLIALEKARKWDASQGKGKRALKKGKSLSAGGGNIQQSKANKQKAVSQAMAQGRGSQDDALTGLDAIANDILFG